MIKRIQEIQSVGCFYDTSPSQYQLEPFTIIYGENRHGKSTLCDVFRSLSHGEGSYIQNRKSIPNPDGKNQSVKINFTSVNSGGESIHHFKNGKWDKELPEDYNLLVFDSNFIHRNVFTGLSIERDNHENVTQFVFGEESVEIAQQIADEKSNRRDLKKKRKELKETAFEKVDDLKHFINLDVNFKTDKLNSKIENCRADLSRKRKFKENLRQYKSKKDPSYLNVNDSFKATIHKLNATLQSSLEDVHEEAEKRVKEHLKSKTKNLETTQGWIQDGLEHLNFDDCPFCGQDLEYEALALIDSYKKYFDDSYEEYEEDTKRKLTEVKKELKDYDLGTIEEKIEINEEIISGYLDLSIESEILPRAFRKLKSLKDSINEALEEWQKKRIDLKSKVKQRIDAKATSVHKSIEPVNYQDAISSFKGLIKYVEAYEKVLKQIRDEIESFKESLSLKGIQEEIKNLEGQLSKLETRKRRIELDEACKRYRETEEKIEEKDEEINELEENLKEHQSEFLNKYFDTINKLYKKLGSDKFEIEKKVSRKGYFPTIKIQAKFAGERITKSKLPYFFSESDRRALALSIFWAKVKLLSEKERKKTIVVLDDPVTSFDEGRIMRSIRLMSPKEHSLRQLIVISHYPEYLKRFFDRTNGEKNVKLLKISKDHESSHLSNIQSSEFVDTAHQKKLKHILQYIQREHEENIVTDLRVYLENELQIRYRKQIIEEDWTNLSFSDLIDELKSKGTISDVVSNKLHEFRKELNSPHHVIRNWSQEEQVALANDVINFIYHKL